MASEPIRDTSVVTAPKDYAIKPSQQIRLLSVRASFDGSGSGAAWLPALQLLDQNGNVLVTAADPNVSVAAGGSADASWFRGVKPAAAASGATTPAATAYLWSQTPHTFTGNVGLNFPWAHFQTTDPTVFGTNPLNATTTPPNNMAGDVNLMLLKEGAYTMEATTTWAFGTTNFYAGLQFLIPDYVDDHQPTTTADLASLVAPMTGQGPLMTQDFHLLTSPAGWGVMAVYLLCQGNTAGNYTVNTASIVCHYHGSGIGADHFVY